MLHIDDDTFISSNNFVMHIQYISLNKNAFQ